MLNKSQISNPKWIKYKINSTKNRLVPHQQKKSKLHKSSNNTKTLLTYKQTTRVKWTWKYQSNQILSNNNSVMLSAIKLWSSCSVTSYISYCSNYLEIRIHCCLYKTTQKLLLEQTHLYKQLKLTSTLCSGRFDYERRSFYTHF